MNTRRQSGGFGSAAGQHHLVEGFAVDTAGNAFVVTDNDGVDNSTGETRFLRLGKLPN
jgi:hypothetical protein